MRISTYAREESCLCAYWRVWRPLIGYFRPADRNHRGKLWADNEVEFSKAVNESVTGPLCALLDLLVQAQALAAQDTVASGTRMEKSSLRLFSTGCCSYRSTSCLS